MVTAGDAPCPCFERREAEAEPGRMGAMVMKNSVRLETRVQISTKDFQGNLGK